MSWRKTLVEVAHWAFWVALLPSAGSAGLAEAPPELIRRESLLTPRAIAELGLTPEVDIEVTVGVRGEVARVEVLDIRPSGPDDAVVEEATREVISRWRYAPARDAQGQPMVAQLRWTLRYSQPRTDGIETSSEVDLPALLSRQVPRWQFRLLSEERRSALMQRFLEKAERSLDQTTRRVVRTERIELVTDTEDQEVARALAANLEVAFVFLDQIFGREIEALPAEGRAWAYVYSEQRNLRSLLNQLGLQGSLLGFYQSPGLLALTREAASTEQLLSIHLHEAAHAYVDRYLVQPGVVVPPWFHEGFASYIGNSRVRKGRLEPGETLRGEYLLNPHFNGPLRRRTGAGWSLEAAKRSVRDGTIRPLRNLLFAPGETFRASSRSEVYGMSWLFVHFLRHGDAVERGGKGAEADWAAHRFPRLMLYLVEGYPSVAALEQVYEMSLPELEQRFHEHIRRF